MRMKKAKKLTGVLLASLMIAGTLGAQTASADSEKVVTLGSDLSQEDQNKMLRYFGVSGQDIRVIYVTNQEERDLLSSYISLDVIGTRTLSCAFVKPTNSGGIQVKTANLNWVTSNMIASALSTSGVKNCEVIAACPREVSGTGALTGVLKAYENASGSTLDANKKVIAAQEIATASDVAATVGQAEATQIINEIKIAVISEEVEETDDQRIQEIVAEAVDKAVAEIQAERDQLVELTLNEQRALEELAEQIAAQKYEYEDVKETLERVENNVKGDTNVNVTVNVENNNTADGGDAEASAVTGDNENVLDEDSILLNTDDSALGEDVITDATTEEALPEAEPAGEVTTGEDELFAITTTDEGSFDGDGNETAVQEPVQEELTAEDFASIFGDINGEQGAEEPSYEEPVYEEPVYEEPVYEEPVYDEEITVAEPDVINEEPVYDDYTEEVPEEELLTEDDWSEDEVQEEESTAPAPQLVFGGEEDRSFNEFSLKLFTDGERVPVSGQVVIEDAEGNQVKKVDLSDSSNWGALAVEDGALLGRLGFGEASEIHVLTGITAEAGKYHVTADVVFAQADDGMAIDGTEAEAVHAEAELTYVPSTLSFAAPDAYEFTTPSQVLLYAAAPEGTASVEVSSSREEVASPDAYDFDLGYAEVTLDVPGDVVLTAEYYNEDGELIGSDSIAAAAF